MKSEKNCLFTGIEATWSSSFAGTFPLHYCNSTSCGSYHITEQAVFRARDFINYAGSKLNQGLMNCGRMNLNYHEKNLNTRYAPIWCTRNERKWYDKHKQTNPVFVIEDVLYEPISHAEKPNLLLERFGKNLSRNKAFAPFYIQLEDQVSAGIVDISELTSILLHLEDLKYIKKYEGSEKPVSSSNGPLDTIFENKYTFTVSGWHHIQQQVALSSKKVFIATAFKWITDDEVRPAAIHAIKEACRELGYEAETVSQNHSDYITNRIISEIRQARFVIAELTYHNRGVYFEAGLARGFGKNVFHVVRKGFTSTAPEDDLQGKRIHFDIQQIMYREWENPEQLKQLLMDWIEATEGKTI
ncbi:MAG: hypothetical protein HUU57_15355 [Bdellovibrio sp.]|nr:hypothetical protein [Bdellovibrio sp.]